MSRFDLCIDIFHVFAAIVPVALAIYTLGAM